MLLYLYTLRPFSLSPLKIIGCKIWHGNEGCNKFGNYKTYDCLGDPRETYNCICQNFYRPTIYYCKLKLFDERSARNSPERNWYWSLTVIWTWICVAFLMCILCIIFPLIIANAFSKILNVYLSIPKKEKKIRKKNGCASSADFNTFRNGIIQLPFSDLPIIIFMDFKMKTWKLVILALCWWQRLITYGFHRIRVKVAVLEMCSFKIKFKI